MRAVSVPEFVAWVAKNKKHTWCISGGFFDQFSQGEKGGSLSMKYIRFHLDTLDMKIYRLEADGAGGKKFIGDFRDEGEGTILDALQTKLDEVEKAIIDRKD